MTRRTSYRGIKVGLVVLGAWFLPSLDKLEAQPPPGAPSAALLRRLAEAVEGHRTGDSVWVVISERPPHSVDTILGSRAAARARAAALGDPFSVHGPFQTRMDGMRQPVLLIDECHEFGSEECFPPDRPIVGGRFPSFVRPTPPWLMEELDSIVVYAYRGSERQGRAFPPNIDALFLSLSGWDKFYYPYMVRVYGSEFANGRRERLLRYVATAPASSRRVP